MVDLEKNVIRLRGKEYPIVQYTAWWHVEGAGLFADLKEALEKGGNVQSVPVALTTEDMYEVI
jgi:hypothetical protein